MRREGVEKVGHLESHLRQDFPLLSDKPLLLETVRFHRAKINEEICRPDTVSGLSKLYESKQHSYTSADKYLSNDVTGFCQNLTEK
jgi:hypothetical protein